MKEGQGVYITPYEMAKLTREMPRKLNLNLIAQKASQKLGYHMTRLRGRGMSFAESRQYQPGDEIRHIDWRVTARTGFTHTKTFEEERDLPVFIVLDQSSSLFIGTQRWFKAYLAQELAIGIGWLACRNQDRFGSLIVDHDFRFTPLKSGRKQWSHFCETIIEGNQSWDLQQKQTAIDWQQTLISLQQKTRPGTLIVLISDFFHHNIAQEQLHQLRSHCDVICIGVEDPIEANPPAINGTIGFGDLQWFYQGQGKDRHILKKQYNERWASLKTTCAELGIAFFTTTTEKTAMQNLEMILR